MKTAGYTKICASLTCLVFLIGGACEEDASQIASEADLKICEALSKGQGDAAQSILDQYESGAPASCEPSGAFAEKFTVFDAIKYWRSSDEKGASESFESLEHFIIDNNYDLFKHREGYGSIAKNIIKTKNLKMLKYLYKINEYQDGFMSKQIKEMIKYSRQSDFSAGFAFLMVKAYPSPKILKGKARKQLSALLVSKKENSLNVLKFLLAQKWVLPNEEIKRRLEDGLVEETYPLELAVLQKKWASAVVLLENNADPSMFDKKVFQTIGHDSEAKGLRRALSRAGIDLEK